MTGAAVRVEGPPARRDAAIDTVRGMTVVTMIAAHLSKDSFLDRATHPIPYINGAFGFVLFSGLLVGIVQRSTRARLGESAGSRKLLARTRLVYLGHLFICLVALTVGTADAGRRSTHPSIQGEGGWASAAWHLLTLQINPTNASVLSLYVVVMLGVLPVLWLLSHDRPVIAAALVAVVYVAGVASPSWSQLPARVGLTGGWAYATWFGLFAVGVLAGWYWRTEGVQRAVTSRIALVLGTGLAVAGVMLAVALPDGGLTSRMMDKEVLGPGRLVLAVVVFFAAWRVVTAAMPWCARALGPLTLLGQRSLDSYLILSVVVVVVPSVSDHDPSGIAGTGIAGVCLLACYGWAVLRARPARRPGQLPPSG